MAEQKPNRKRKPREPKRLRFEVVSVGAPGPVAVLTAQMIALDAEPARIRAAVGRLRGELGAAEKTA